MALEPEDLVGTWVLAEWRIAYPDGRSTHPFGKHPNGLLLYTHDGAVSATVAVAHRPPLDAANPRRASAQARAEAFDGCFHYAGHWRIEGEAVLHDVSTALNPGLVGTTQRRQATVDEFGGLTLSATERSADGSVRQHSMLWHRPTRGRGRSVTIGH